MKRTALKTMMALILLTVLIVGGCSNNSGNDQAAGEPKPVESSNATAEPKPTEEPQPVEDTTPVTIQYWHSHNERQMNVLNFTIAEFQKEYPYITVEEVYQGGYADLHKKLQAAVAANDVPAVTNVEVSALPNFADGGVFTDLTPYIERDKIDMADFSRGMLDAYAYNDRQYGFPLIVSAGVFVYNKTMLDNLGVTPPQTWAEIDEFNRKVTVKEGGETTVYAFSNPGWDAWYVDPWITNGGGTIIAEDGQSVGFDQPDSLRWLEKFREWTKDGYVHMGYGPGASSDMRQMFLDQKAAMVMHSSATLTATYLPNATFEVGVSFPPGDKNRISNIGGAGIVLMDKASDRQKEAGWKFLKFMTDTQYNIKWAEETGYLPTHKSVVDTPEGKAYFEAFPQFKTVLDNFDNVIGRPQHPAYPEVSQIYMEPVGRMILEDADPIPLLQNAVDAMNAVLKDYQ